LKCGNYLDRFFKRGGVTWGVKAEGALRRIARSEVSLPRAKRGGSNPEMSPFKAKSL